MRNATPRPIIVDNFYREPEKIEHFARGLSYRAPTIHFPGKRSVKKLFTADVDKKLSRLLGIQKQPRKKDIYNGCFQLFEKKAVRSSYIHVDNDCDWAGIVYLSQGYDGRDGTRFFRHRETGFDHNPTPVELTLWRLEHRKSSRFLFSRFYRDRKNYSAWKNYLSIPFKYNRLVLYPSRLFHNIGPTWGSSTSDARLTHNFFLMSRK